MSPLTHEEQERYQRHLVLKDFGMAAQEKLKQARVLVIGAGGLGAPVLLYLSAAGVGTLGIADFDTVSLSNLQRQVLFTTDDVGKPKATTAAQRLHQHNPSCAYPVHAVQLTAANTAAIIRQYDVIIDATDNFPSRYLINDCCILEDKPLIYGAVNEYEGHVSVFNQKHSDNTYGPNYRDLFPEPPPPDQIPSCATAGVLGVVPGIIGCIQANEAIKLIAGIGNTLSGRLLIVDSRSMETTIIRLAERGTRKGITQLIDYYHFCGISDNKNKSLTSQSNSIMAVKEITVQELQKLKETGADFQLIDVREPHEFDICNLEGELIPLGELPDHVDAISKDKQVVIHCRSGARSGNAVQFLEKNHGFSNLYNLKGGILAWAKEIDPSMPTY